MNGLQNLLMLNPEQNGGESKMNSGVLVIILHITYGWFKNQIKKQILTLEKRNKS